MHTENLDKLEELSIKVGRMRGIADMLFMSSCELDSQPFEGAQKETASAVFALMFDELGEIEKELCAVTRTERKAGAA